ncbi:DUF3224 domain-containing protein [Deinococcus oregonensis]|uniref:DUF3224 domain-containing protein n=1 Tax=Deinococcus oregonensis TaxID=1805970 RepID=A0ABV6B4U4_9DEIO
MPQIARGIFSVHPAPGASGGAQAPPGSAPAATPSIGRTLLNKVWTGDLTGHSLVEMLSSVHLELGSAAPLEGVTATLHGRSGTSVFSHLGLQHRGT